MNRTQPPGLILLYHRVASLEQDPFQIAISPEHFAQQMAVVAEVGAMTVDEAATTAARPHAVAVTFDDGYRDNLVHALPALRAANVPATIYITTGPIGTSAAFWWDELAALILDAPATDAPLRIAAGGRTVAPDSIGPNAIFDLWRAMRRLPASERDAAMEQVRAWARRTSPLDYDDESRVMTADELRQIAAEPLITLGGHTVTHPVLASLNIDDQRREITDSRTQLEAIIERPVQSFAYPFGRPKVDHTRRTAQLVAEAGYASACAVLDRELTHRSPALTLPRWAPPNVDGETFRTMLLARLRPPSLGTRARRAARERVQSLAER